MVLFVRISDQIHFTNIFGDKNASPVDIRIGNLPSARHTQPGLVAILLPARFPGPLKLTKVALGDKIDTNMNVDTL